MKNRIVSLNFMSSKDAFTISVLVVFLTIICVWLFGLGHDRTFIENSYLSTGIISLSFFIFISISLYRGVKLKDTLGDITDKFDINKVGDFASSVSSGADGVSVESDDIISGIILSVILWIVMTIVITLLAWIFGAVIWFMVLLLAAMLYWVFFRALKLIFRNSKSCKGNLSKSLYLGVTYTVFYSFWIFGLINVVEIIKN